MELYALPVVVGVLAVGFAALCYGARLALVLGLILVVLGVVIWAWWAILLYLVSGGWGSFFGEEETPDLLTAAWILALVGGVALLRKGRQRRSQEQEHGWRRPSS